MKTIFDTRFAGVFGGTPDQVAAVRRAVETFLDGHPLVEEVKLITSELASNAVLHSKSAGGQFIVRVERHSDHVRVEVQDAGGPWFSLTVYHARLRDERPHGLDVVEALAGPDGWGIDTTDAGRVVWARVSA